MKTSKFILILVCIVSMAFANDPKKPNNPIDDRVKKVMEDMTLEDKVGEMTQLSIDVLSVGSPYNLKKPNEFDPEKLQKVLVDLKVGSILNAGGYAYDRNKWEEIISTIQAKATKEKKSGIPVLYGIDAIHGTNYTAGSTLFPQQLGVASTWDTNFAEETGSITAYETRASGIPWSFSPVLDIGRDARWPRLWETYGEDVYLAKKMGISMIKGYQGDDVSSPYKVAACLKHFLGYGFSLTGKDRAPTWLPERQLREYYLPTFKAAIEAGAKTIMICSGEINGIPVHADKRILVDLLRDELGFEGLTVSDWEDIGYLVSRHRVAADYKEAIAIAVNAGVDLAMVPMDTKFPVLLKELVEEGKVSEERIDEAVARIIKLKVELGLFEKPVADFDRYEKFGSEEHRLKALAAAEESIILLKNNENTLPFKEKTNILVSGPTSDHLSALNGGWTGTWQGRDEEHLAKDKPTIIDAIRKEFGESQVQHLQENDANYDSKVAQADIHLVCLGELSYTEKPGDIDDMDLPEEQVALVNKLKETGKPIVLLLLQGRPRIVKSIEPLVDAILLGFYPGNEGAEAISNIISGKVNPSGRLPITYPKNANDLITYDHKGTDLAYRDFSMNGFQPQWEFGYGLSYTDFAYSNLVVTGSLSDKAGVSISVDVSNIGTRDAKEVVQLYVRDEVATITPSVKRLRGFEKVSLNAGELKTVKFNIAATDLAFVGQDNTWITEKGFFEIIIKDLKERIEY